MGVYISTLNECITRLKGTPQKPGFDALGIEVTKLKEFQADYRELAKHQKARVTVGYLNSRYGADQMGSNENDTQLLLGRGAMGRAIYYSFTVASVDLESATGAIELSEKVERLMIGFKPSAGGEFYAFSNDILALKNNVWYFQVLMRVKNNMLLPLYEDVPEWEEPLGANITKLDFPTQIDEDLFNNTL